MSFPNIPNITPSISLTREDVINLLLASIAMEELSLSHIVNAEAEKIQAVLGTLKGVSIQKPTLQELIAINNSVGNILRDVIKKEMLLQFKLEEVIKLIAESTTSSTTTTTTSSTTTSTTTSTTASTTTSTSTTTTTTTSTTTTKTTTTSCAPGLTFAVFANNNFLVESQSVINAGTQVNGNMTVTHIGNTFLGNTNVVFTFTDHTGGNNYQNLVLNAAQVPFKNFDSNCLQSSADLIVNGEVEIAKASDAAIFQGRTVWVNGPVSITGDNISITGGGILATGGITVSGGNFTYTSTKCFALYSEMGDIRINKGPYSITGLVYTSATAGDIRLAASEGGSVCGALVSGRDVIFTGGSAIHSVTNAGCCNPCLLCNDLCP